MEKTAEFKLGAVEQLVVQNPEIVGLQAYEYFRNDNAKQKEVFLSGEQPDLDLTYPDLTLEKISELEQDSRMALTRLMSGEKNIKTESLFRSIEYRYSELYMLACAADMLNKNLPDEVQLAATGRFKEANEALYGKPDAQVFAAVFEKNIGTVLSTSENNQEIRNELSNLVGEPQATDYKLYKAPKETVELIHDLVVERFGQLVDHIDPEHTYSVDDMRQALQTALEKIGGPELGWKIETVSNSSALSVAAYKRTVEVGENRKEIQGNKLRGKVLHEIGVHTLRSIIAEKAGYIAAAYGQDGYLDFEEAFGTALEDAYAGKFADHGVDYYVIAGLAYGLDNHASRNFRECYEIMWRTKALKASSDQVLTQEQIRKAQSDSFRDCMRMFRGTNTKTPGVVYLKDLSYFRGQELVWPELSKVRSQEDFDLFFTGKLDLTQADHKQVAQDILSS